MLSTTQNQYSSYIVAIVDNPHVWLVLASFARENTTNQTTDVLLEDQLQPPLDLVTVVKERELHNPYS